MLRWKRKVIAFKSELTYGQDAAPAANANAILVRNVTLRPLEMDYEERNVVTSYAGHQGEIIAGQRVEMTFEVELAGAGAAGTAPGYGALLKAAACSETINAGVSVVYAPVNPGAEVSGSLYFWLDGKLHKVVGTLADAGISLPRGRVGFLRFSLMGLFVGPVDQALPVPALGAFQKPVAVNNANTTPMTLHAFAGKFSALEINFGNVMRYRNLVGSEAIRLIDRKSTGSVTLEDELVATKDWYTTMKNGTLGALSVTHGQSAGNKVVIAAPNVQLTRPQLSPEDELAMKQMSMVLQPSAAGNDEWLITVQ